MVQHDMAVKQIEEKNPLKQGLKPQLHRAIIQPLQHWREESIKTRIETGYTGTGSACAYLLKRRIH